MKEDSPSLEGVREAAARIAPFVTETPLLPAEIGGVGVRIKAECLQRGGSFKLRGASNRLMLLGAEERKRGVVAFSSGNHAIGVALAAERLAMPATIVMPSDAPAIKRERVLEAGAEIVDYVRGREPREEIAARLAKERGAALVPSFDDVDVIEGQGSVGIEIGRQLEALGLGPPPLVVAPCGGGGLSAGIALALPEAGIAVVEPAGWDDMARSLDRGEIVPMPHDPPPTRCDALMTPKVSRHTFDTLMGRGAAGLAVGDEEVMEAMRFAALRLKLVVEPGGAVALAAALAGKVKLPENAVIVVSGGNVDLDIHAGIIGGAHG
ncbi:MAG: threonine/serine dehydratase [Sphingomonadaceae bacterium]